MLQSYGKTREMQKENWFFFCIAECIVSSAKPKLRKNEGNAKGKLVFLCIFAFEESLLAEHIRIILVYLNDKLMRIRFKIVHIIGSYRIGTMDNSTILIDSSPQFFIINSMSKYGRTVSKSHNNAVTCLFNFICVYDHHVFN